MRIAIDISQIIYEGTGVGEYTRQLVKNLLLLDKMNQYILFSTTVRSGWKIEKFRRELGTPENIIVKNIPISQTIGNLLWNRMHIFHIEKFLGRIDIFHSSDWIQPPSHALKVTTVHDLVVYKYPQFSHRKIIETQKRKLYWVKRECEGIIADSLATKDDLVDCLGIHKSKIRVIYPGINETYMRRKESQVKEVKSRYTLDAPYFLAVGTREPRKNIKTLLEAYIQLKKSDSTVANRDLVIIGKAGWGEEVSNVDGVKFIGYVPKEDLPYLYAGAEMFIYPSLYEGFGFPVLEAMASGIPVITSPRGSLKEITRDAAMLVNPESSSDLKKGILLLIKDKNLKRDLIDRGYENAKRFQWKNTASETLAFYTDLYRSKQ
jgi:glycosyltransferase involved in cell wall biosynthesis